MRLRAVLPALAATGLGLWFVPAAQPSAASGSDQASTPTARFQDRVIGGPIPERATATARAATSYAVAGGGSVQIEVDPLYAGGPALQRVLDTLGALVRGAETSSLRVRIADSTTLAQLCGQGSTACYYPASQRMVISGEPTNPNNQMSQEMVIAHEYGHHIEANRSIDGWYATHLGPRHWATYERVCQGVAAGELFPGNQGVHYWENPGEAFAQAYATMHHPSMVPWWWSFAEPDAGAFDAIRADVADTSQGGVVRWAGRLNPNAARVTTAIDTPLDGPVEVKLRRPRSARFDLALLSSDGNVVTRARTKKPPKAHTAKGRKRKGGTVKSELSYNVCGTRSLQLELRRRAGKGKFTARIHRP